MSQATVKARRREIRRAVGTEALGTIVEHQQQVALLSRSLMDLHRDLVTLRNGDELRRDELVRLSEHVAAFQRATFYERLRWLLFGS